MKVGLLPDQDASHLSGDRALPWKHALG